MIWPSIFALGFLVGSFFGSALAVLGEDSPSKCPRALRCRTRRRRLNRTPKLARCSEQAAVSGEIPVSLSAERKVEQLCRTVLLPRGAR